jgi:hypothetical protein
MTRLLKTRIELPSQDRSPYAPVLFATTSGATHHSEAGAVNALPRDGAITLTEWQPGLMPPADPAIGGA